VLLLYLHVRYLFKSSCRMWKVTHIKYEINAGFRTPYNIQMTHMHTKRTKLVQCCYDWNRIQITGRVLAHAIVTNVSSSTGARPCPPRAYCVWCPLRSMHANGCSGHCSGANSNASDAIIWRRLLNYVKLGISRRWMGTQQTWRYAWPVQHHRLKPS
jgi:hypothetical protein